MSLYTIMKKKFQETSKQTQIEETIVFIVRTIRFVL